MPKPNEYEFGKFEGMVLEKLGNIETKLDDVCKQSNITSKKVNRIYYFAGGVSATVSAIIMLIKYKLWGDK